MTKELCDKWTEQQLAEEDIRKRLTEIRAGSSAYLGHIRDEDITQVARCIFSIYQQYHRCTGPGSWLRALASDSFSEIMDHADENSLRGVYLYRHYLKYDAPRDWRQKLLG